MITKILILLSLPVFISGMFLPNETTTHYCPTIDTNAYILVTNTPRLRLEDVFILLRYYADVGSSIFNKRPCDIKPLCFKK